MIVRSNGWPNRPALRKDPMSPDTRLILLWLATAFLTPVMAMFLMFVVELDGRDLSGLVVIFVPIFGLVFYIRGSLLWGIGLRNFFSLKHDEWKRSFLTVNLVLFIFPLTIVAWGLLQGS